MPSTNWISESVTEGVRPSLEITMGCRRAPLAHSPPTLADTTDVAVWGARDCDAARWPVAGEEAEQRQLPLLFAFLRRTEGLSGLASIASMRQGGGSLRKCYVEAQPQLFLPTSNSQGQECA